MKTSHVIAILLIIAVVTEAPTGTLNFSIGVLLGSVTIILPLVLGYSIWKSRHYGNNKEDMGTSP